MADLLRMRKVAVRVSESDFPFVVQIGVPDGSFECTLGAVNAWHHHNGIAWRRRRHDLAGEQQLWGWYFGRIEIAKAVRQCLGGQMVPVALRSITQRDPNRMSWAGDIRKGEP